MSKVPDELAAELKAAEAVESTAIEALKAARYAVSEVEARIALAQTDIRPGDMVEHHGDRWKVSRVKFRYLNGVPRICGYKIRKDGTPGTAERELRAWREEERPKKVPA